MDIKNFTERLKKWGYLPLVLILAVSSLFYFHNLGSDYITLWDEAVHVNVVKNLANACCTPTLLLTDIGIDFQDWTSNHIWVHKPLAPLYLQALIYKVGGHTLFSFRLPSALFALMSVVALFFVARKHFGYMVAIIGASLLAFNPYMFELVKGRQFSGLHDLVFLFFGILALNKILLILNNPAKKNYLLFGLFVGLAFLSKGGLALLFFPALFAVSLLAENWKQSILNFFYAGLIALIIIFPEKIILYSLYPAEYYFEQRVQVLHLFKALEYWGRPWDYYFSVYLRDMLLPYLYLPALAGLGWGIHRSFQNKRLMVLIVWALSFLIPLSFGVTKISNFIFATLPAMLILLVLMLEWLWEQKHNAVIFALSATVVISYIIIRLDVGQVKYHLFQIKTIVQRFEILFFSALLFFAIWVLYRAFERYRNIPSASKTLALLALFLILGTYLRANQLSDQKIAADNKYQANVKKAAIMAKGQYSKDSIFLLFYPELPKSHLFFKYWSGLEALEIYDRQPIFVLKKILPKNRPLLISSEKQIKGADVKLVEKTDFGYVYRLNH